MCAVGYELLFWRPGGPADRADEEVLAGCRALQRAGYRPALDDFWFDGAENLLARRR